MPTPTHEYRATVTIPLHGSDRQMSLAKAEAGPILDRALADIAELASVKALGVEPVLKDTTVRLGTKKTAPIQPVSQSAPDASAIADRTPPHLLSPDGADARETAHPTRHRATEG